MLLTIALLSFGLSFIFALGGVGSALALVPTLIAIEFLEVLLVRLGYLSIPPVSVVAPSITSKQVNSNPAPGGY